MCVLPLTIGPFRTGNQKIIDAARAKWGTAANMRPHYDNLIRAVTECPTPICKLNPRFDPKDLDADGVPNEPEALYVPGEEWRFISFDEMKCDDKTHGDGGDRKSKSERTIRCGPEDIGECVGSKHTSHPASVVGGTMGSGEALACYAVTAGASVDLAWFANGPTTTINGKLLKMDGTCNAKGSVDNSTAIEVVKGMILRSYAAYELPTAERPGVVVCDGVGSHLSPAFCDFLIANHLILVLRTPNCSQKQQPEDLVSFHRVKNAKAGKGFYAKKQVECLKQLHKTCSAAIPYDVLFGTCLREPWENAFSYANNREAWRQAGLHDRGGITARPYWLQLCAEQPVKAARKKVTPETRRRTIDEAGLGRRAQWEALTPCWMQNGQAAHAPDTTLALAEDPSEDGGEELTNNGRLTSGELSQLGCAATDPPAQKFLQYKLDISAVKQMKADELKAELTRLNVRYTRADDAKVVLLRSLESTYSSTPTTCRDGRVVKVDWRVRRAWLPAPLQALMFPQAQLQQLTATAPAPKKRRIGEGAYTCGALPSGNTPLLLQSPTPATAAAVTPNAAVDAAAAYSTSINLGVAAQPVSAADFAMAHGWWATLEPDKTCAVREVSGPRIKLTSDYSEAAGRLFVDKGCDEKRAWTRAFGIQRSPFDPSVAILHTLNGAVRVYVNGSIMPRRAVCILSAGDRIHVTAGVGAVRGHFSALSTGESTFPPYHFTTVTLSWKFYPEASSERAFAIMAAHDTELQQAYLSALEDPFAAHWTSLPHIEHCAAKQHPKTGAVLRQLTNPAKEVKAPTKFWAFRRQQPMDADGWITKKRMREPELVD